VSVAELVDGFASAVSGRDRVAFSDVCALDVHYEDPLTKAPARGLGALADHVELLWRAFPDAALQRSGDQLASARFVAAPLRLTGLHENALGNVPATGRRIDLHGIVYCELEPDRELLWRIRSFFDLYEAGQQLGVLPPHGGFGERAMLMARGFGLRGTSAAQAARGRLKQSRD
jgi:steroid delta-isomerase-like uncharacterized protein